ncbi:hypothetical protein ASPZODRAFT_128592 [Penicilliopsis zonata CBS 506.65]|uniref:Peptidase M24 domain-containing protein n=1 Tax=Penicilliopsis zonata CBS 506.65 TaxID=1073090 RepID=A0A1L9SS98_9EURO|nr:hypothetical protein ASPZODRAFT_128592 [Penicilliopsis zonata CBS 506.65]OJJ50003.1 hypothetical protein ASPZODRAFT_128592 [Penicilliopsis zonata CBS 506.65]
MKYDERTASLLDAQDKAEKLFAEIEATLLRAGVSEKTLSDEIHALGTQRYNVRTHWHKRVVRSGPNTLLPFAENPPDRILSADEIVYVDLGPVFEDWEADFGRTYVLGCDEAKHRLRDALEPTWRAVRDEYLLNPAMTGEQLYEIACRHAVDAGFEFGAYLAGHIVGSFPHERIPRDKTTLYITRGNDLPMDTVDKNGERRHWILEIHLHDKERQMGAFFEQLLV